MTDTNYFATEQAEKAAKWDMLQALSAARSRLAVLKTEREKIGKALTTFGTVLENTSWEFAVDKEKIVGRPRLSRGQVVTVSPTELDFQRTATLLRDYEKTEIETRKLTERLQELGAFSRD